jgi:hypothetical protein
MKKLEGVWKLANELATHSANTMELQIWWSDKKTFATGDFKKLLELLDNLVLQSSYVRNKKYRSYGSEYFDVVVQVLKMAELPINDKLKQKEQSNEN